MLNNLYSFKKDGFHVKAFKWIYGTDPTKTFNTMCPYFWSWMFTIAFCWLIIPIRLLGSFGKNLLSKTESYKRDRLEVRRLAFIDACNKISTDKDAYRIRKTRCWSEFGYCLDNTVYCLILDKSDDYRKLLAAKQHDKEDKRSQQIKEIKTSKYFPYVAYTVTAAVLIIILYTLYAVCHGIYITYEIDYKAWTKVGGVLLMLGIIGGVGYAIFTLILSPLWGWLSCMKLPNCKLRFLLVPFIFLGKGIVIFCDMIYMTYKKACPRMFWED